MTCLILFYFSLDLKADALARTNIKINMEKFLEVSPMMAYLELLYFFPLTLSYAPARKIPEKCVPFRQSFLVSAIMGSTQCIPLDMQQYLITTPF